jgi:hypothetical protein
MTRIRQPISTGRPADVVRIVSRDFPVAEVNVASSVLNLYGTDKSHNEPVRVRLAALKLAAGRLDQLKAIVQEALLDYRDVIGPAEYPGYGRLCHSGDIPIDVMNKTIADDSKQYNDWLRR